MNRTHRSALTLCIAATLLQGYIVVPKTETGSAASVSTVSRTVQRPKYGALFDSEAARSMNVLQRLKVRRERDALRPAAPPPPTVYHTAPTAAAGVYLTASSVSNKEFFNKTMDRLAAMTGAALVIDVKGSFVYFESDAPLAAEMGLLKQMYDLPTIVTEARSRGIYTIARYIAVKDPSLALRKDDTHIRHPVSGRSVGAVWVDPAQETVLRYNREIIEDLAATGIDEINLDYIRYPTEYGLESVGLTGEEKAEKLNAFLRMAREAINSRNPRVKLGVSTFAILGWNVPVNFPYLGQDIAAMGELVDIVSPMAYPDSFSIHSYYDPAKNKGSRPYHLVYRTMTGYRELLGPNAWKLRPWIQAYNLSPQLIRDEIQGVFDSGACGFTFWSAGNLYENAYAGMKGMKRPDHCVIKVPFTP